MPALNKLALTAALTLATAPAWAALTYTASGNYNLGTPNGPGATTAMSSSCGINSGTDALEFNGSGADNVGIHAYACDDSTSYFGSRASGENTYYAQGIASVSGLLSIGENDSFSFFINAGEVGAFGSSAFLNGEFQKASLTIKLTINGQVYLDEAWSAEVGEGGAVTKSYDSNGSLSVGYNINSGSGYYSYGIAGGPFSIDLAKGDYDISYVMTSTASGNVSQTSICTAYLQGNKGQEGVATFAAEVPNDVPPTGEAFTSYCGAGARSGDPFPGDAEPIARAQATPLPEPMSAGLALTALLAAAGVRRRNSKR